MILPEAGLEPDAGLAAEAGLDEADAGLSVAGGMGWTKYVDAIPTVTLEMIDDKIKQLEAYLFGCIKKKLGLEIRQTLVSSVHFHH